MTTRTHTIVDSPVGDLTLVADGDALCGLFMESHRRPAAFDLGRRDPGAFRSVTQQLAEYFAGRRTAFDVPLAPRGEPFQQRVWASLLTIPYGETRT